MFIAIEGMDGVGKTTISKLLAETLHFYLISNSTKEFFKMEEQPFREFCNKLYKTNNDDMKACFFGFGNIYSSNLAKNHDIIVDRHILSNFFWNGNVFNEELFKLLSQVTKPDISILLYADVDIRLQRLYERDPNDKDLFDKEKHVLGYDKMIYCAEKFEIPYCVVNTNKLKIEDVFNECKNILLEYMKRKSEEEILDFYTTYNKVNFAVGLPKPYPFIGINCVIFK